MISISCQAIADASSVKYDGGVRRPRHALGRRIAQGGGLLIFIGNLALFRAG